MENRACMRRRNAGARDGVQPYDDFFDEDFLDEDFFAAFFFDADFFAVDRFDAVFLDADFFADDFFADDFFADDFFADFLGADFFADDFFDRFGFGGTFPPARRASDRPIAIACLRLVTFLPERPLLSLPCLRSSITFLTFACAFLPYFAMSFPPFASWTVLRDVFRGCGRRAPWRPSNRRHDPAAARVRSLSARAPNDGRSRTTVTHAILPPRGRRGTFFAPTLPALGVAQ